MSHFAPPKREGFYYFFTYLINFNRNNESEFN